MKIFLIYLAAVSIISCLVCCYDKLMAKWGKRRISENALMWLSVLGGAAVMYITMCIIRHKTKHNKFMVGLPIIILLQTAIVLLICTKFS